MTTSGTYSTVDPALLMNGLTRLMSRRCAYSGTVFFDILKYAFTRTGLPSYENLYDSDSESELEDEGDVDSNGL